MMSALAPGTAAGAETAAAAAEESGEYRRGLLAPERAAVWRCWFFGAEKKKERQKGIERASTKSEQREGKELSFVYFGKGEAEES